MLRTLPFFLKNKLYLQNGNQHCRQGCSTICISYKCGFKLSRLGSKNTYNYGIRRKGTTFSGSQFVRTQKLKNTDENWIESKQLRKEKKHLILFKCKPEGCPARRRGRAWAGSQQTLSTKRILLKYLTTLTGVICIDRKTLKYCLKMLRSYIKRFFRKEQSHQCSKNYYYQRMGTSWYLYYKQISTNKFSLPCTVQVPQSSKIAHWEVSQRAIVHTYRVRH